MTSTTGTGRLGVQLRQGRRRRGVAGDDEHLHVVLVEQVLADLLGEAADLVEVAWSVRIAAGVADVHEPFVGQQVDDGPRRP